MVDSNNYFITNTVQDKWIKMTWLGTDNQWLCGESNYQDTHQDSNCCCMQYSDLTRRGNWRPIHTFLFWKVCSSFEDQLLCFANMHLIQEWFASLTSACTHVSDCCLTDNADNQMEKDTSLKDRLSTSPPELCQC